MREHNRIATLLKEKHPDWNDETLYQESRRIVIAEYQHIIYDEWLPQILGKEFMASTRLSSLPSGYLLDSNLVNQNNDIDPRISNEFAVAAFRFGHSLVPSSFKNIGSRSQTKAPKKDLRDLFFNPRPFIENK